MRFRTAGALSVVLVVAMLVLPRAVGHLARSYIAQGIEKIPSYQIPFFEIAIFLGIWWWALAPLRIAILFTVAIFTSHMRPR